MAEQGARRATARSERAGQPGRASLSGFESRPRDVSDKLIMWILGLALLAALIACTVLAVRLGQLRGRRVLDEIALIRCHEDRQAALRRNADDKLVRVARMVVGAARAQPDAAGQGELARTINALGNYLDHIDGKVSR